MTRSDAPLARTLVVTAQALRPRRRMAAAVTAAYVVVYLWAIQNVVVSLGADLGRFASIPSVQVVPDWPSKVFKQIAAFYYEPVVTIYPTSFLTVLVSPVNLAMGLVLGALVGLNVAVAVHVYRTSRSCRRRPFTGLLGALPGFLTGFACCVPTVALVLGTQFAVALVALRSWFFPFALAALLASLAWNARRAEQLATESSTADGERLHQPA